MKKKKKKFQRGDRVHVRLRDTTFVGLVTRDQDEEDVLITKLGIGTKYRVHESRVDYHQQSEEESDA